MKWWGLKLTVGRTYVHVELGWAWPCLRWEWRQSLMAPVEYGVGVAITRDWA